MFHSQEKKKRNEKYENGEEKWLKTKWIIGEGKKQQIIIRCWRLTKKETNWTKPRKILKMKRKGNDRYGVADIERYLAKLSLSKTKTLV